MVIKVSLYQSLFSYSDALNRVRLKQIKVYLFPLSFLQTKPTVEEMKHSIHKVINCQYRLW